MYRVLRHAAYAALALLLSSVSAMASQRTDCRPQAIRDLQRLSPQGHAIYTAMTDKKLFMTFLTCDDVQNGLSTAVHESVHILTSDHDAYPLIGGGSIRRQHEMSKFFAPREIARHYRQKDMFVTTYLGRGSASSADDFTYLLDELNAYSHDLASAVKLAPLHRGDTQAAHRDGLAALMSFVATYADTARSHHPATWQGLQRPEAKKLVRTLWTQAEHAIASSCGMPRYGDRDRIYLRTFCSRSGGAALGELLGRAPVCPTACMPAGTAAIQ